MKLETSSILNTFATIFFIISVIYFSSEVVFQLSPVTKSLLIFSMAAIMISAGVMFSNRIWSALSYISGFLSYIVFLIFTISRFDLNTEVILGFLLASALGFSLLGNLIDKEKISLDFRSFKYIAAALIILSALITAVDMTGAQTEYTTQIKESIVLEEGENRLGTVTATNNFFLARTYELPDYEACRNDGVEHDIRPDVAHYETEEGVIAGSSTREFDINFTTRFYEINPETDQPERKGEGEEFQVELSDGCPNNPENGTVYVFKQKDNEILTGR